MKVDWHEMTLHEKKAGMERPRFHEEPPKDPSASYSLDSLDLRKILAMLRARLNY